MAALPDRLNGHLDATLATLDELRVRWSSTPSTHATDRRAAAPPAAPLPSSLPVRRPGLVDAAVEDAALGALLRAPHRLAAVTQWLRHDDFAAPGRTELYAVIREVHARGDPVDTVTVLWEAHRRDLLQGHPARHGDGGSDERAGPRWLLALTEQAPPGDPAVYAARVVAAAVTARAAAAGLELRRLPGMGLPPARLLPAAHRLLTPLARDTYRLRAATRPLQHPGTAPRPPSAGPDRRVPSGRSRDSPSPGPDRFRRRKPQ